MLNDVLSSRLVSVPLRVRACRRLGLDLGRVRLSADMTISGTDVRIGDGTFVNSGCFLDGAGPVRIGERCDLGQRVAVHTVTHEVGDASRRAGPQRVLTTTVGDGVWIGAGAVVLPGVHVGDGVVVAAGSVVTRDCAPNGLYAGSPARRVKELGASEDEHPVLEPTS